MAITHSLATRNLATNAVVDQLDGAASKLVFRITGSTVLSPTTAVATLTFSTPAFGASSAVVDGRADAGAITSDTNVAGGTVAFATLETAGGVVAIHCAVTEASGEINMTNGLVVASGDTISCSSLTYTALSA